MVAASCAVSLACTKPSSFCCNDSRKLLGTCSSLSGLAKLISPSITPTNAFCLSISTSSSINSGIPSVRFMSTSSTLRDTACSSNNLTIKSSVACSVSFLRLTSSRVRSCSWVGTFWRDVLMSTSPVLIAAPKC